MSPSSKELSPESPSIDSFEKLVKSLPQGEQITRFPEARYSIPQSEALLIISHHISDASHKQAKIEFFLALPGQNPEAGPSDWVDKSLEFPSDWPHTQFGFHTEWLIKGSGYQQLSDFFTSADFQEKAKKLIDKLTSRRRLALDTAQVLTDSKASQSSNDVYDHGVLYLYALNKPSRRLSYDSLEVSFFPSGIISVKGGLYNPKKHTFSQEHFLFDFTSEATQSQRIVNVIVDRINSHLTASKKLKELLPTLSIHQTETSPQSSP